MKRLKDKRRKKSRIIKTGCSFFYMFSSLHLSNFDHRGYALYRINIDEFNDHNNKFPYKKHHVLYPFLSPTLFLLLVCFHLIIVNWLTYMFIFILLGRYQLKFLELQNSESTVCMSTRLISCLDSWNQLKPI